MGQTGMNFQSVALRLQRRRGAVSLRCSMKCASKPPVVRRHLALSIPCSIKIQLPSQTLPLAATPLARTEPLVGNARRDGMQPLVLERPSSINWSRWSRELARAAAWWSELYCFGLFSPSVILFYQLTFFCLFIWTDNE